MILTTNTQALVNYNKAAEEILALIDDFGFTTDKAFDVLDFKSKIVQAMVSNTQTSSGEIIDAEIEEQEPTNEDLEKMLEELEEEDELAHSNICPECGNLMSR